MINVLRNFWVTLTRFKLASILNIVGLAIAFASFIVITMQVNWECRYGKTDKAVDSIFRFEIFNEVTNEYYVNHHISTADLLINATSNVTNYARLRQTGETQYHVVKDGEKQFFESIQSTVIYNDISKVFDIEMLQGKFENALVHRNAVISSSTAKLLFGDADPIGKEIFEDDGDRVIVAGVHNDLPGNAIIKNGVLIYETENPNFGIYSLYVKVKDPRKIGQVVDAFHSAEKQNLVKGKTEQTKIRLINVGDIYFDQMVKADTGEKGNLRKTNILLAIAILIILIAVVNFINFYTALAPIRVKALNTRIVFGSSRAALRWQIVCEGVGLSVLAFLVSLVIVDIFNATPFRSLIIIESTTLSDNMAMVWFCAGLAIVIGFVAGLFPAFYCTKFEPAMAIKGAAMGSQSGKKLRMTLVGFQYVISMGLIICAIFINLQHRAMLNAPLGYDKMNLLRVEVGKQAENLVKQLKEIPNVKNATIYNGSFGTGKGDNGELFCFPNGDTVHFFEYFVDQNFLPTIGLPIIEGENFTDQTAELFDVIFSNEKPSYDVIVNQKTAKAHNIKVGDLISPPSGTPARVVGICGDFVSKSLVEQQTPVVFTKSLGSVVLIKIDARNTPKTVEQINKTIKKLIPENPPTVVFYDQHIEKMYNRERDLGMLITLFSIIAIIISLVGVFGLVVFETQYRRKEIGIRKVFGSTVKQILMLFNKKFVAIIVICFVVATPIAYFAISRWLSGFAYKTPIYWWVFALGGLVVSAITIAVITAQTYASATENPIKSIKTE